MLAGVLLHLVASFMAFVRPLAAHAAGKEPRDWLWRLFAAGPPLAAGALLLALVVVLRREQARTMRQKAA